PMMILLLHHLPVQALLPALVVILCGVLLPLLKLALKPAVYVMMVEMWKAVLMIQPVTIIPMLQLMMAVVLNLTVLVNAAARQLKMNAVNVVVMALTRHAVVVLQVNLEYRMAIATVRETWTSVVAVVKLVQLAVIMNVVQLWNLTHAVNAVVITLLVQIVQVFQMVTT
ncbi:MAG: hypothetical protein VCF24_14635, partial [Candidatus Latescibacterota bacterium]